MAEINIHQVQNGDSGLTARNAWNNNDAQLSQAILSLMSAGRVVAFAAPTTTPVSTEYRENVAYFATSVGTYANFNSIAVIANELAVFTWGGSQWVKSASWTFSGGSGGGGTGGSVTGLSGTGNSVLVLSQTSGGSVSVDLTHSHSSYITGISKTMVENVLKGDITTHEHSKYLNTDTSRAKNTILAAPSTANGTPSFRALTLDDLPSGIFGATGSTITDPNIAMANTSGVYTTGSGSNWPTGFTHPGILTVMAASTTNIMQQAMDANGGMWTRRRTGTAAGAGTVWKKLHHVGDTYDGNLLATGSIASQQ